MFIINFEVEEVVGEAGLNLLINNAGLLPTNRDLASVTPEDMRQAFEVNCVAPLFFTKVSFIHSILASAWAWISYLAVHLNLEPFKKLLDINAWHSAGEF